MSNRQTPHMVWLVLAYALMVPAANWTLETFGFLSLPLLGDIPSGAVWIGCSFVLRDVVQERAGTRVALLAVALGVVLSLLTTPTLALASAVSFGLSEVADGLAFGASRSRGWSVAVLVSSIVGAVADSLLFLGIAFGGTRGWLGLTVVKAVVAPLFLVLWRRRS